MRSFEGRWARPVAGVLLVSIGLAACSGNTSGNRAAASPARSVAASPSHSASAAASSNSHCTVASATLGVLGSPVDHGINKYGPYEVFVVPAGCDGVPAHEALNSFPDEKTLGSVVPGQRLDIACAEINGNPPHVTAIVEGKGAWGPVDLRLSPAASVAWGSLPSSQRVRDCTDK